jgi:hypothetical protein
MPIAMPSVSVPIAPIGPGAPLDTASIIWLNCLTKALGPEHADTLASMNNLATVLAREGYYAEAERLHRQTLDIRRRVLGPEHPDTLASVHNLAIVLYDEGRYTEAERLDRETLDIRRGVLGPEHPDTLASRVT